MTSIENYVSRMQDGQPGIYYITGESKHVVSSSPFLERLKNKDYEVLFLSDPMDEYVVQQLKEFDGKKLISVTKANLDMGEDVSDEESKKRMESLCKTMKETLADKVDKVIISNRLTASPCILVTGEYGWSANMERIMKAQALGSNQNNSHMVSKKTMEINADNPIIDTMLSRLEKDPEEKSVKDLIWLLYDTSLLDSGFSLDEPTKFTSRIHRLIKLGLSIDEDDEEEGEGIIISEKEPESELESQMESEMEQVD